jgi:hypothetical protein
MRRWTPLVLAAVLVLAAATPAFAQWKWRDKGGQTQYSDLPPPAGTPDQDILQRPVPSQRRALAAPPAASGASAAVAAASGAPLAAAKGSEPELEARRRKADEEAAAKKKTEDAAEAAKKKADDARLAAGRADNCTRAQSQMRSLDSGVRMSRTNEKGEIVYLDDATRSREAQRAREIIASDCK